MHEINVICVKTRSVEGQCKDLRGGGGGKEENETNTHDHD